MPRSKISFFVIGLVYRVPMMIATAFQKSVAIDFMRRSTQGQPPIDRTAVLFLVHLDPDYRCDHALLIDSISLIPEEAEFLYVAYSGFTVKSVRMPDDPSWSNPVIIDLKVAPDNAALPAALPL